MMIKKIWMLLLFAFLAGVKAMAQNTVTTVVTGETAEAADVIDVTKNRQSISFNLNTIPAVGADYGELQLTCAQNVGTAVAVKLLTAGGVEIANHYLKKGYLSGRLIIFNIPARYLYGGRTETFKLQLGTAEATVIKFYGAANRPNNNQQYAPRLVLKYNAGEVTGTEWASINADARHSGRSRTQFRGANPDGFVFSAMDNLGDIKQDLLVYNGRVLVVTAGKLMAVNTSTFKADVLQPTQAPEGKSSPVVDAYGNFYYPESGQVSVIELNNGNRIKPEKIVTGNITNPLTIGPDGRLYVTTADRVSAYSPYPQNKLLWDVRVNGDKSAVVLNDSAGVAYIINRDNGKAVLKALDANNGRLLDSAIVKVPAPGDVPAPVTDRAGNVYYTNKAQGADSLYVLNYGLNQVFATAGANISLPAGELVTTDNTRCLYFVKNAQLYKYLPATRQAELVADLGADPGVVSNIIADRSNNTYVLGKRGFFYRPHNGSFTRLDNVPITPDYKLVLAADGTLFAASQTKLLAIKPGGFSGGYQLGSSDTDQNFNFLTFRAGNLTVNDGFKFINNKVLISTGDVKFKNGIELLPAATVLVKKRGNGGISFGTGFKVNMGASFTVTQNY